MQGTGDMGKIARIERGDSAVAQGLRQARRRSVAFGNNRHRRRGKGIYAANRVKAALFSAVLGESFCAIFPDVLHRPLHAAGIESVIAPACDAMPLACILVVGALMGASLAIWALTREELAYASASLPAGRCVAIAH